MFGQFKERSYELEHIDKGDYTPEEYQSCIIELQRVNRWLGDVRILRNTLLKDIDHSNVQSVSILDVGAGSGELLRVIARWALATHRSAKLVGLELNPSSARAIADESQAFCAINSVRGDAFELPFVDQQFDYVVSSLFTHHFTNSQVVSLFREMSRVARHGIYLIDLHRHPVAYYFYTTIGRLMFHNRLLREDGALSILRSFKPVELLELGREAGLTNVRVERHFPYRLVLSGSRRPNEIPALEIPRQSGTSAEKAA